jgi:hypothetical protein
MKPITLFLIFTGPSLLAADPFAILEKNCLSCHAAAKLSGLDLRTRAGLLQGGTRGPAFDMRQPESSLLLKALQGDGLPIMPPGKYGLSEPDRAALVAWVKSGAPYREVLPSAAPSAWWSFRPLNSQSPPIPDLHPIDAFLEATLRSRGLSAAPQASKLTLVRRAYFDLHGLPPSPAEVEAFLKGESTDAWPKMVDRLLASPRYGERWGRHWLDVVRYADTGGFENDLHYANAWRYRDYVVKSFNDDKPYNIFIQEQVAADEIWPDNLDLDGIYELSAEKRKHLEARIGTGLYTIGSWIPAAGLIPDYLRSEKRADRVDVTGAVFLGLSFGCARCHDHKFDPIPQRDYYRLGAIFEASDDAEIPVVDIMKVFDYQKHGPRVVAMNDLRAAIKDLGKKASPERDELLKKIGEAYLDYPGPTPTATVLGHRSEVPAVHIEVRGDYKNKGPRVAPGLPSFAGESADLDVPVTRLRKALAEWLSSPKNPLTARVIVNRVWQGHFGAGLVRTPNDFGRQGEAPTHPELLDWLALRFMEDGWSLKKLHRLIMSSDAYRRSNEPNAKALATDPENRWLWRMSRRRLEAEAIRDSILSVSGNLNLEMHGPAIAPPLSDEEMEGNKDDYKWPATVRPAQAARRSVYLYVKRAFRFPLFEIFDAPDPAQSCPRREATNVPPQALALLNNAFVNDQARVFATRLRKESEAGAQIERAWRMALGRAPTSEELAQATKIVMRDAKSGLENLCLTLFNLNEFLYID